MFCSLLPKFLDLPLNLGYSERFFFLLINHKKFGFDIVEISWVFFLCYFIIFWQRGHHINIGGNPPPFVPLPSRMPLPYILRKLLRLCRQLLHLFRQLPRLLGLLPRQLWLFPRLGNHEIFCYHVLPPIFKPLLSFNGCTGKSNQGREWFFTKFSSHLKTEILHNSFSKFESGLWNCEVRELAAI